jgi:hypothetical protein
MTEVTWKRSQDRREMLQFVHGRISERKFRLFAVACCRRQWELFPPVPHRQAIKAAEQFADGIGTHEELLELAEPLIDIQSDYTRYSPRTEQWQLACAAEEVTGRSGVPTCDSARFVAEAVSAAFSMRRGDYRPEFDPPDPEQLPQVALLRDIVGNPFLPTEVAQDWLTSTVVALARQMYRSRDFSAMPILADALQDADCDNDVILDHCRGPGPHVRGCWVVDLILGKE